MKNKGKSKKVQAFIDNLQKTAMSGAAAKEQEARRLQKKKLEEAKENSAKELASIFKPLTTQTKVAAGADPKTVICEFFKKGACTKGSKCKFSHDWQGGRKSAKIDIYSDPREKPAAGGSSDAVDLASTEKTEAGSLNHIVCWHFLEAVQAKLYGHFWKCPNGADCRYRHSLPPGYVLKEKTAKVEVDEEDEMTLDEKIEEERAKMVADGKAVTPCTLDNFKAWKERKRLAKEAELEALRKAPEKSKGLSTLSGRDLFQYDPTLFVDDESADADVYELEDIPEETQATEDDAIFNADDQDKPEIEDNIVLNVGENYENQSVFLQDTEIPEEDEDEEEEEKQ